MSLLRLDYKTVGSMGSLLLLLLLLFSLFLSLSLKSATIF